MAVDRKLLPGFANYLSTETNNQLKCRPAVRAQCRDMVANIESTLH